MLLVLLMAIAPWLCEPLCAMFHASVREGSVLLMWKKAYEPVPKAHLPTSIESDV